MFAVLYPTYTLEMTVKETMTAGSFAGGQTGCDEILARARKAIAAEFGQDGESATVRFMRFEHRS